MDGRCFDQMGAGFAFWSALSIALASWLLFLMPKVGAKVFMNNGIILVKSVGWLCGCSAGRPTEQLYNLPWTPGGSFGGSVVHLAAGQLSHSPANWTTNHPTDFTKMIPFFMSKVLGVSRSKQRLWKCNAGRIKNQMFSKAGCLCGASRYSKTRILDWSVRKVVRLEGQKLHWNCQRRPFLLPHHQSHHPSTRGWRKHCASIATHRQNSRSCSVSFVSTATGIQSRFPVDQQRSESKTVLWTNNTKGHRNPESNHLSLYLYIYIYIYSQWSEVNALIRHNACKQEKSGEQDTPTNRNNNTKAQTVATSEAVFKNKSERNRVSSVHMKRTWKERTMSCAHVYFSPPARVRYTNAYTKVRKQRTSNKPFPRVLHITLDMWSTHAPARPNAWETKQQSGVSVVGQKQQQKQRESISVYFCRKFLKTIALFKGETFRRDFRTKVISVFQGFKSRDA